MKNLKEIEHCGVVMGVKEAVYETAKKVAYGIPYYIGSDPFGLKCKINWYGKEPPHYGYSCVINMEDGSFVVTRNGGKCVNSYRFSPEGKMISRPIIVGRDIMLFEHELGKYYQK